MQLSSNPAHEPRRRRSAAARLSAASEIALDAAQSTASGHGGSTFVRKPPTRRHTEIVEEDLSTFSSYVVLPEPLGAVPNGAWYCSTCRNSGLFPVEAVLDKRLRAGRTEYKLRWEGWSEEHDSWEQLATIPTLSRPMINEFNAKRRAAEAARARAATVAGSGGKGSGGGGGGGASAAGSGKGSGGDSGRGKGGRGGGKAGAGAPAAAVSQGGRAKGGRGTRGRSGRGRGRGR